jgi:hypothetical protein
LTAHRARTRRHHEQQAAAPGAEKLPASGPHLANVGVALARCKLAALALECVEGYEDAGLCVAMGLVELGELVPCD